jgi:hypothetical protein
MLQASVSIKSADTIDLIPSHKEELNFSSFNFLGTIKKNETKIAAIDPTAIEIPEFDLFKICIRFLLPEKKPPVSKIKIIETIINVKIGINKSLILPLFFKILFSYFFTFVLNFSATFSNLSIEPKFFDVKIAKKTVKIVNNA